MNRILITHSYFYKFDPKQWNTKQPYPPLGTLYAASVMRKCGFDVALFDTNLADSPADIISVISKVKPYYLVIYDDVFNYLSKMCLTKMREAAFELVTIGKQHACKIITAGSDSSDNYEKYLDAGADYVILGEGELTLRELISTLENGNENLTEINGIVFRENGRTIKTAGRSIINNLDELPFPAWDLIDIESYREIWMTNHGFFSINIATTRGCPYKCNWCAKPIYGNRYNSRSPENVIEEVEYLITEFKADAIWFCDDIFGLKPGWINEFRNMVHVRKLKFRYKIQSRADLLLKGDTIDALYESGVDTIWIGAESGSQIILDAMEKGTTVEQIYKVTQLLKMKNIKVAFFIQLGYPGETKDDISKTIRMIRDLLPDDIGISVSYPLPGTKFYEKVKDDLTTKANWIDSDDLAMMFKNAYPPEYYKKMHHYIHGVYRLAKSLILWRLFLSDPFGQNWETIRPAISGLLILPRIIMDSIVLKKIEGSV